jgi:hypothetical protein
MQNKTAIFSLFGLPLNDPMTEPPLPDERIASLILTARRGQRLSARVEAPAPALVTADLIQRDMVHLWTTPQGIWMTTLALAHRANVDRLGNYGTIMRRGPQQHQKPRNFLNRMLMYVQHLAQEAFPPQDTDPIGFAVLLHRNSHELLAMPHIHSA